MLAAGLTPGIEVLQDDDSQQQEGDSGTRDSQGPSERRKDGDSGSSNRVVGDVNFGEVVQVASLITPVPGGVGPNDHRRAAVQHDPVRQAQAAEIKNVMAVRPSSTGGLS